MNNNTPDILNALFGTADVGILVCDLNGQVIFGNQAAALINGNSNFPANPQERLRHFETQLGDIFSQMKHDDLPSMRALREIEVKGQEIVLTNNKGEKKDLVCNSRAVFGKTGELVGAVVIIHDRTNLKTAVKQKIQLEKERSELMALNKQLEQFSAIAAHDLKSPLNSITQFVDVLKAQLADRLRPNDIAILNRIQNAGARLRSLIDDLLAFAKSGKTIGEIGLVEVGAIVAQVLNSLHWEIEKTKAKIDIGPLPNVFADKVGLSQVFQNLIANAIKYHGQNAPLVEISSKEEESFWHFTVKDNGRGFKTDDKNIAFELFRRFESSNPQDGTGLGLPICKKIIEAHGGRIAIESEYGIGTTVTFALPKIQ